MPETEARMTPSSFSFDTDAWVEAVAPGIVGAVPMDVAQNLLKQAMLIEALQRTSGNLSQAGRLLGVTRQAIQQMLSRYNLRVSAQRVKGSARRARR